MAINLEIDIDDQLTPALTQLVDHLKDPAEFHKFLALDIAEYTRYHIREAAKTRHKTRDRLGLAPGNYLAKAAETVEAKGDSGGVTLRVAGPIFKRVNGPVTITPREKKYLTIPVHADAVGKLASEHHFPTPAPKTGRRRKARPRLITGLIFITSKKGNLLLARPNGDGTITPYYALKASVTLPQDPWLLPSNLQLGQVAEKTARWYINRSLRRAGLQTGKDSIFDRLPNM